MSCCTSSAQSSAAKSLNQCTIIALSISINHLICRDDWQPYPGAICESGGARGLSVEDCAVSIKLDSLILCLRCRGKSSPQMAGIWALQDSPM